MKKLLVSFLFLTGCTGPLVNHETARSVGDGNHELTAGYGLSGYVLKWNYGLTQNWDLGLHLEQLNVGLRTKYSLLNLERGPSLALAGGVGSTFGGGYYHGDVLASWAFEKWEPYLMGRGVSVKVALDKFVEEYTGPFDIDLFQRSFVYWQTTVGTRYWFNKNLWLSLEGSRLFWESDEIEFEQAYIFGAALGVRF